ncbi:MAG: glucokinase [Methylotetracoccus sp.]
MILAGDIGGTKTVLALYREGDPIGAPVRQERYPSQDYPGLEPILERFLDGLETRPAFAAFGIAGPVLGRTVRTTNLPWSIDAIELEQRFGFRRVDLLNDLQSMAGAVPFLAPDERVVLHAGIDDPEGPIAVVAPGTGLGVAFLVREAGGYRAFPTEGGHMSFGPCTSREAELLAFLRERFGHVSYERIASGSGLPNIYDFLVAAGHRPPDWLAEALRAASDPTPVIVDAALSGRSELCSEVLDLFVSVLGGAVGSIALLVLSSGGICLGGGIPPRILDRLRQPDFLEAIHAKGRSRPLLERMPVFVMLDASAALHGAAWHARASARRG